MPSHSESRVLPYTSKQLFDLVMDIEKYPEFLPWCIGARINDRHKNEIHADVIVGYKFFREKFTSRVYFIRPDAIEVEYLKGPLRQLQNKWLFKDLKGKRCKIDFYVSFDFKAPAFQSLVDQFFHRALAKMVAAFEKRAKELYGEEE